MGDTMRLQSWLVSLALMARLLMPSSLAHAAATLEVYGTFHAMGIVVTIASTDDPDRDAVGTVEYRLGGSGPYRQGFPLARVTSTRFVGSLFWLAPGTTYNVRVTFSDPDGDPLHGVVASASASTRAEITVPAPNHSYYASPAGGGTACSLAAPCTLIEGLNQAQPGDEVVLRDGIYYQGEITPLRSGTAGAPIVIRGYSGETAVLDGADPTPFTWTARPGGVYRTTVTAPDPHLVLSNGQRLYPYQSLADLENLIWGLPGFYASGTTLDVHLTGDVNPGTTVMIISRYESAFYVDQRDSIYFLNLTFRHYGLGDYGKAIYFNDASDNLVQGCTFAINDLGIGLKYDSHRNIIQDNTFYDADYDWPWNAVKAGSGLETGGIRFYDPTPGRGNVIRRNTFHDYFDGLGVCPDSTAGVTNETDVYENLVYRASDDGIETDGQCSNVRIWGNTFHDVLMGISLAPVYTGPVYAIRNLVYRTGAGNSGYTGSPFKFNSGYGTSGPMYLFHNTGDAALPGNNGLYVKAPGTWSLIYARNNIWAGTAYAVENYNTTQPIDLDYSDLWNAQSGDLVRWNSTRYATLPAFSAATGQESHGLSVAPDFADAIGGNYTLSTTSHLIDAGVAIPGINDDYAGTAPDIGAFEYRGYGFGLSAFPPARAIAPGDTTTYTIGVQSIGGFSSTVTLVTANPSPSLTLDLNPTTLTPTGRATLTVTDSHAGPSLLPGVWYTIPITATGGGITQTASARLLVGGINVWLPIVSKGF